MLNRVKREASEPVRKIHQVTMVGDDFKRMFSSLQPMSPLLKGKLNSQQFLVADIIITYLWGQFLGKEGTWIESRRFTLPL